MLPGNETTIHCTATSPFHLTNLIDLVLADRGWDVFTLHYTVRGPLSTMLEPSMIKYHMLFKRLWALKHVEYVVCSKIWKDMICHAKVRDIYKNKRRK